MFVRDRMSAPAVAVRPGLQFQEALRIMREGHFRRLPVVDGNDRLMGIISERDLLHASPSPATSLSVWELNYLLSELKVEQLMTKRVIVATPEMPIEEAARKMVDQKIGGMPVVDGENKVVGVITETDIFKAFVEMLGSGEPGLRMMLEVPYGKGTLASLAKAITDIGGNIVSVATFHEDPGRKSQLLVKVAGIHKAQAVEALESLGDRVLDVREV